jgi:signal transduction histidine kinase/CheY-like chemotaxis protein
MMSFRTVQAVLGLVTCLFVGTSAYTSALIFERQSALSQISRYNVAWLASQATTELARLNQRLSALNDPKGDIDPEQVQLRYEILVNRLKVFETGEFQEFVRGDPDREATVANFATALGALEPLVYALGRPGSVDDSLQITGPLETELSQIAAAANQFAGERAADDQKHLLRLHNLFSGSIAGLIACGVAFLALLLRNNSLLRRAHGELRILATHLQGAKETAERAQLEAEQGSRAKTEFLAAMSHEIRTPLNGILGFTDILLDRADLPPDAARQLALIKTSGESLLTVVNDVLDFSKIEAGAIELDVRPFSIEALAANCVAIMGGLAASSGLDLRVGACAGVGGTTFLGDESRLRQILLNLLNNAIKFTPAGSVELRIEREAGRGDVDWLTFSVTDTGIGIPKEHQGRLFRRFSQVDGSASRQYGGTGLGLAISKSLVDHMQGEIGVRSEPGKGSTFWFSVPMRRVEVNGETRSDGSLPSSNWSARILVAEDVEINQEIARAVLTAAGHTVDVVSNGAEAVMAVQNQPYDLVLMDVQMPVMDGLAATRHIRSLDGSVRHIPIIATTANVFAEQVAGFAEAGMNDHVAKPFVRSILYAAVERWARNAPDDAAERGPVAA